MTYQSSYFVDPTPSTYLTSRRIVRYTLILVRVVLFCTVLFVLGRDHRNARIERQEVWKLDSPSTHSLSVSSPRMLVSNISTFTFIRYCSILLLKQQPYGIAVQIHAQQG
jgi:hypothetical protein